jgi:hypothetical protein
MNDDMELAILWLGDLQTNARQAQLGLRPSI